MATASVNLSLNIGGLAANSVVSSNSFSATAPDALSQTYKQIAVANTEEAIDTGDISVTEGVLVHCIAAGDSTGGIHVDCDFVSAFDADLALAEGDSAYFKPVGVVKIKNLTADEQPTYEVIVFGTR